VLTISAEKQKSAEDKTDHYTRREFHYASFKRSFQLPDGVKEADIKATYKDGVLNLELPPVEEKKLEKGRTIEIQ
jgi:HSP20 family protein